MSSKYTDISATIQVIGNVYMNPALLDDERYFFNEEDFTESFHKVIFGSIYNLYNLGVKEITISSIEDYLESKPNKLATYKANKGEEWLSTLGDVIQTSAFKYYYNRMKKMTLLRMYDSYGIDISWLYDADNLFDQKKKQAQDEWLDSTDLTDIADIIDKKITNIRAKYVEDTENNFVHAGEGVLDLLTQLKETPEMGYPFYDEYMTTILRGARLKKFYLRSAATGVGKTRAMVGDACFFSCGEIYDSEKKTWIKNGTKEPTIYIATEQDLSEIQTLIIAYLSDVDEDTILSGKCNEEEWARVLHAIDVLKDAPLHFKSLPDFSLQDIENTIKFGIREWDAKYVCFDYIHSSMKILGEVAGKAKVKLREDNVLFMISIRLKDLCNQYGVFLITSTQLNGDYATAQKFDQNLLRGAKAIADKVDAGMIMLDITQEEHGMIEPIVAKGYDMPNVKMSVYKNRRGRYKDVLLWAKFDKGTCRFKTLFVTDYQYQEIPIKRLHVDVYNEEEFTCLK